MPRSNVTEEMETQTSWQILVAWIADTRTVEMVF
jgi:hypothetical protein